MPQDTIVPNLYSNYRNRSNTLEPGVALAKVIKELLQEQRFGKYRYEELVIQNQDLPTTTANQPPQDASVTFTISTQQAGNIGQITFTVNEAKQQIETRYSNEILEAVFQPLFTEQNYYIPPQTSPRQNNLGFVGGAQRMLREFYASAPSLQFAAKIEEIQDRYENIKSRNPALNSMGSKKLLKRGFFGQVQENEEPVRTQNLTQEQKIIAEINEIAQTEFFRTPVTNPWNPGSPESIAMLKQRLDILNVLSQILDGYSKGTPPNKNKIDNLRVAVKALNQLGNYAESKTQRIVSAVGMGIGIPALIAGILLLALFATASFPLWMLIVFPILIAGGAATSLFSILGFHASFPEGVAKDLYFVADKMEVEFDKRFPGGTEVEQAAVVPQQTTEVDPTLNQVGVEQGAYRQMFADPPDEKDHQASELRALLKSACTDLEEKEQKHLADGLNKLLVGKAGYDFSDIKNEITESKGKTSQFELLCTAFGVDSKIPEEKQHKGL